MRRIDYKKILSVALLTASFLFLAPQSPADARGIFTPFIDAVKKVVSQQKPAPSPDPIDAVWKGNGTINGEGLCSNIGEFDDTDPAPGKQEWLFILTSPEKGGNYELSYEFDDGPSGTVDEPDKAVGSIHFIVESPIGAVLKSASATGGTARSVLTVSHCEINPVLPLVISKTADTSFTRTWTWDIEKTARATDSEEYEDEVDLGPLEPEDVETVHYKVTVSAEDEDSDHAVSGEITIENPAENPTAVITSISDVMSDFGDVDVDCQDEEGDVEFPYELPAGETLICTYSENFAHDDIADRVNTVTVETDGVVPDGTADADVKFSEDPTLETDECIDLSDTEPAVLAETTVCQNDLIEGEYSQTYELTFSNDEEADADVLLECGVNEYENVASFVTNDTGATGESEVMVLATVDCPVALLWCSPGFWGNAAKFNIYDEYINENIVVTPPTSISGEDLYSGIPDELRASLKNGSPSDPTIDEVLNNPSTYGGPAMNSVADYFAYLLGWGGTQDTGESCPLDAHGNWILEE
jgi:hypothetical protein